MILKKDGAGSRGWKRYGRWLAAIAPVCWLPLLAPAALCQVSVPAIVPERDSLGSQVTIDNNNQYQIQGGTRSGQNLFHGFEQFGVPSGTTATFWVTPDVSHVLARVSGGQASLIDGLLRLSGGSADLFLMNPAGIVFGPGARLDVPGSFLATTATAIGLSDRTTGLTSWFPAWGSVAQWPTWTGQPDQLAFSLTQPGAIANLGTLAVPTGASLSLIGGTVLNTGQMLAPGGSVTIAAVPGTSLVRLSQPGTLLSLEISPLPTGLALDQNPGRSSPVLLPQLLTGSGLATAQTVTIGRDGQVHLGGAAIDPQPGWAIMAGQVSASAAGSSPANAQQTGGQVTIVGDRLGLFGAQVTATGPNGGGTIRIGGNAHGGPGLTPAQVVAIDADSLLDASALFLGDGGRAIVWANDRTWMAGTLRSRGGPLGGAGGWAEVSGKTDLTWLGTADLTAPQGSQGTLLLDPLDIRIASGSTGANNSQLTANVPSGQSAGVILTSDSSGTSFTISETALESLSGSTNVQLEASQDITIDDLADNVLNFASGTGSVTFTAGRNFTMNSGDRIAIQDRRLTITATNGNLTLGEVDFTLNSSGTLGSVALSAGGNVTTGNIVTLGRNITISAGGTLTAGTLNVNSNSSTNSNSAGSISLSSGGNLVTSALLASGGTTNSNGGSITATSQGSIRSGEILADANASGTGTGGTVSLRAATSIDASRVSAQGGSSGTGGTVSATAGTTIRLSGQATDRSGLSSSLSIASGNGGGQITINTSSTTPFTIGQNPGTTGNGTIGAINGGKGNTITSGTLTSTSQGNIGINPGASTSTSTTTTTSNDSLTGNTGTSTLSGSTSNSSLTGSTTSSDSVAGSTGSSSLTGSTTSSDSLAGSTGSSSLGGSTTNTTSSDSLAGNTGSSSLGGNTASPTNTTSSDSLAGNTGNATLASQNQANNQTSDSLPGSTAQNDSLASSQGDQQQTNSNTNDSLAGSTTVTSSTQTDTETPAYSSDVLESGNTSGRYNSGNLGPSGEIGRVVQLPPPDHPRMSPDVPMQPGQALQPSLLEGANQLRQQVSQSFDRLSSLNRDRSTVTTQASNSEPRSNSGPATTQVVEAALVGAGQAKLGTNNQQTLLPSIAGLDALNTSDFLDYADLVLTKGVEFGASLDAVLQTLDRQTGTRTAILYTFSRDNQLDLVLIAPPAAPIYRTVSVAANQLRDTLIEFRTELTDPSPISRRGTDYLATAQKLYDWVIRPIAADLEREGVTTIAFILDRGLRTLPIAALHDGQKFLVERYSLGLMPSISLTSFDYSSLKNAPVLGFGASQFTNQTPLPAVPTELQTISRQLGNGETFLNEAFTIDNIKVQRQSHPFPILHLATHADFRPGGPSQSYIQLWNQRLRLNDLRDLRLNVPPIDLLVLSACRTAIGDDSAELGFAGLALQSGVKTGLASLWSVSDEGTLTLMSSFYAALRKAPIKAEALRQAQLAMLRGQAYIVQGKLIFSGGEVVLPPELANIGAVDLRHPYYWSAFTIIGSPW